MISVDDTPMTIIFDQPVEKFAIELINGGVADSTLAKGDADSFGDDAGRVFRQPPIAVEVHVADAREGTIGCQDGARRQTPACRSGSTRNRWWRRIR